MYQVVVFDEEHEEDLTEAINDFFATHPTLILFDVKFSCATTMCEDEQIYCFSAMLIYRDKEA